MDGKEIGNLEEAKSGSVQNVLREESKVAGTFDLGLDNQGTGVELKSPKRKDDGTLKESAEPRPASIHSLTHRVKPQISEQTAMASRVTEICYTRL